MSIRDSIMSLGSRMIQRQDEEINFDVMTFGELRQMQDDLLEKIWMLTLENDVYERFLTRQDQQSLKTIAALLERAKIARRVTTRILSRSSHMSFRESILSFSDTRGYSVSSTGSSRSSRFATSSLITVGTPGETSKIGMAHRIMMSKKEVEEVRRKLETYQRTTKKKKSTMKAEIEEIEIRINEVQEANAEFEEDVIANGVDPITGKIPAERVIRFIEEWLKSVNTIIERLRLKSATARMLIRKAKWQLVQREELGESLHSVDFEKLSIENQDYVTMLEEKNLYVIDMKRIAGHYHLKLTQHKQKLDDLLVTLNEVKDEMLLKENQIKELTAEHKTMQGKVKWMTNHLNALIIFMDNYIAPNILDFVRLQEEYTELEKAYKSLQRRTNIEKTIYKEYQKQEHRRSSKIASKVKRRKTSDTIFPIIF